jgi:hypothetical protein
LVVSQRFFFIMSIWLRFKGFYALRGKRQAEGGSWGTFTGERISSPDELSGQGRGLY